MSWLPCLIRFQPWVFSLLAIPLCVALLMEGRRDVRRLVVEFALALSAAAVYFFAAEPLAHIQNDSRSFIWSLVLLFPVLFLGLLDFAIDWELIEKANQQPRRRLEFAVPLMVAAAVGIVDPGTSIIRAFQTSATFHIAVLDVRVWLLAIAADVLLCAFLVSLYNLPELLHSARLPVLRFVLYKLLTWFVVFRFVQNIVLDALPFHSTASQIYSGMLALTLVISGGSYRMLFQRMLAWRRHAVKQNNGRLAVALGVLLLAVSYLLPALIGLFDWNYLLAKMWTLALWTGAFATAFLLRGMRSQRPYPAAPIVCILVCCPLLYVCALAPSPSETTSSASRAVEAAFEQHLGLDTSYRVVEEWWAWQRKSWPWRRKKPCDELCQYLLTQTDLPTTAHAAAVDVTLAENLAPVTSNKPNIFIFVVDSLRRDYVSAYNPAVNFTPEIGKFAAESTVFRNSFTRYTGTALSEAAIWTGTMFLHKKYLQPFHNLNNLEKLLDVDGYQRFISVDAPVLQVVLQRTPDLVPLDENVRTWTQEDFCSTTGEAEAKIKNREDPSRPIFVFAQPQNIHTATLSALGPDRNPKRPYPGFRPKIASELERLDGCFGKFIQYLKVAGLYDNSIIVLTADHGDSLGELGRQGHVLEVNPSVLRIPLIVHIPKKMKNAYYYDPDQVAFNIDVTPTIYYLLGHRPIVNDPSFGRPLFTKTSTEAARYRRENYLVASAYGAVYGVLSNNGRFLFVSNAIRGTNEYYDLEKDPEALVNRVSPEILVANQKLIRDDVQQIASLYQFRIHQTTFVEWLAH